MLHALVLAAAIAPAPIMTIPPPYFPIVSGKPVRIFSGVLTEFEIGAKGGSLDVRLPNGHVVDVRIAGNGVKFEGKTLNCVDPPRRPHFTFNRSGCAGWPAALRLGSAHVDVPVWDGTFEQRHVWVTDEIIAPHRG